VAIIFIGTFFQMVLMVAEDVRRVPLAQIEAAQTMGATRREIIERSSCPRPSRPCWTPCGSPWAAWTYLVVAELVAANSGLGYAVLKAQRFLQTDKIFAGILMIGLIGLHRPGLPLRAPQAALGPPEGLKETDMHKIDAPCSSASKAPAPGLQDVSLHIRPTSSSPSSAPRAAASPPCCA
jgi:hypothetical protein